jgi:DNA (cytosine-5)-methyltransferase 1
MNELALFAGAGGGILGGHLLGWRTVCAVELDAYARSVLLARQRDGLLPRFPVWDDVRTFDGKPWRGSVQVLSGGFPCQDISAAGTGDGLDGERSGLWVEMARIVGEVRPGIVFVENSPMLASRGLDRVLGDLASLGFDARWGVLGADDFGAPHSRKRLWLVAHAKRWGCEAERQRGTLGAAPGREGGEGHQPAPAFAGGTWWQTEPGLDRVADEVAHRVVRTRAIGNGQVPAVAAGAWRLLTGGVSDTPNEQIEPPRAAMEQR